jgi:hypothetical protein
MTAQAISPLRRRMIKGLTIRTTVPNPCKSTTTLNVTPCSGQMRGRRPPSVWECLLRPASGNLHKS